ncbi:retrovirus-related pol polyprotein from transposon TNT 1-94 [Tanacetum coccineum]
MQQPMINLEDISDPTTAMNMALVLIAKAFKLNYSTPTNNNQRISSNPRSRHIVKPGMNMGQERRMRMVGGNGVNQFKQYVGQNVGNQNGYNAAHNGRNQHGNGNVVVARAEVNGNGNNGNQIRCYNCRGMGHLTRNCTVRPRRRDIAYLQTQLLIAQKEEAGIQLQAKEFDLMAAVGDLDEIEEVTANCILMANLQQALTSGTQTNKAPVYDSYGSAEVHEYENYYNNEIFNMFTQEEQYTELLEPISKPHKVQQNDSNVIFAVSSVEQSGGTVEQHPAIVQETQADESLVEHKALEYEIERLLKVVVSQDIMSIVQSNSVVYTSNLQTELDQCKYDKISYDKAYNDMQQKIVRLQSQLGDLKGTKIYSVTPFPNSKVIPKVGKTNALSKPVTSNSAPSTRESNVVNNDRVIAPGMFRINHFTTYREKEYVPNKPVKASVRTKPITVSQPSVIHKQNVNSNSNGLSSTGVDNTAKTRGHNLGVIQICLWCIDSGCSKHMTGNLKLLINFVWKFLGTVRFGNHHVAAILGYGDLQWGNILIARVYYVEGLGHNLFSVEQFCDSDLEDIFVPRVSKEKAKKASHPPKPVPNSKQRLHLLHMDLCSPMRVESINGKRTAQQNGVVERRNRTLVEAARTMLIFSGALLFLWAEAIATTCYTQNRSIIYRRFNKTPYELINGRKPDISFLHVFGALCYPKNGHEDIGKLGAKGDIGFFIGYSVGFYAYRVYNRRTKKIMETMNVTFDELSAMAFEQRKSKPRLQSMTSRQISSGLDLTYASSTITSQKPTERKLDLLFEAMYDDYIGGQPSAAPRTTSTAQAPQVLQTPTASTTIDTAPTPTISSSQAANIPNTSQDVDELEPQQQHVHQRDNQAQLQSKIVADNVQNATFDANTFVNSFAPASTSAAKSPSSQYVVLIRNQLRIDGEICIYALTVVTMEPRNVKEAMTDPSSIDSMQEELLQFKRLDVWVLVPALDNIKPLTLKWLFKNKHDEENTVIRNKTRLVVRGYRQ